MEKETRRSDIVISVTLDENKHPVGIQWKADESGIEGLRDSKGLMLSLFDQKDHTTMRIDLWTKQMMIEEMQLFYYETLASMADTYERATQDKELGKELRTFAQRFGEKAKILKGG